MCVTDKIQKYILIGLLVTSALAWISSVWQPDMMLAMTTYNPLSISLFTAGWTVGMAAMMFPAITPMVLLYSRLIENSDRRANDANSLLSPNISVSKSKSKSIDLSKIRSARPIKLYFFTGSYLFVWAITGIVLLLGWSIVMNNTVMMQQYSSVLQYLFGGLLVISGAYQFTPLKSVCLGYCESPLSFFMRRWRDGALGALKMGIFHGIYCLGCCWPYFLLMVALGWMTLIWMGIFAGIIFVEKVFSRGIWAARVAGAVFIIAGIMASFGMIPSIISSTSMSHLSENHEMGLGIDSKSNGDVDILTDMEGRSLMPDGDIISEAKNQKNNSMKNMVSQSQSAMPMKGMDMKNMN